MDARLTQKFPQLTEDQYGTESPKNTFYNCIAYAAGRTNAWWQPPSSRPPGKVPKYYWPPTAPDELSVSAITKALETCGYTECADGSLELGYEKVAIYDDCSDPHEFHASRQLESGWWVSKFGRDKDLEHKSPEAVTSWRGYRLRVWMKRPRQK